jgi:hypothetical protein
VRVRVDDFRIVPTVVSYIQRMGFAAHAVSEGIIHVSPLDPVPDNVARLELDLYLSLWRVVEERHDVALVG